VADPPLDVLALMAKPPAPSAVLATIFAPEARARRVVFLLAITALMCFADLALTLTYTTSTGMVEVNPVARAVIALNSPAFVVIWKLATMALGLGILWWARKAKAAEIAAWFSFVLMLALCVYWLSFAMTVSQVPTDYAALAALDDPRWVSMTP
jgi:hypothetical protein